MRAVPQLVGSYLEAPYTALGTDGFGRSDTRVALRNFFEIDRKQIVLAALASLARQGSIEPDLCAQAIRQLDIDTEAPPPWQ